jgi:hypothetical protein
MRQRALDYMTGLLSPVEHMTNWKLPEAAERQTHQAVTRTSHCPAVQAAR